MLFREIFKVREVRETLGRIIVHFQIKLHDVLITVHSIILCWTFTQGFLFCSLLFLCETKRSPGNDIIIRARKPRIAGKTESYFIDSDNQLLWRRANARNVSFFHPLRWLSYVFNLIVNTKLPVILSHRRSTTVSLETYPLNAYTNRWLAIIESGDNFFTIHANSLVSRQP